MSPAKRPWQDQATLVIGLAVCLVAPLFTAWILWIAPVDAAADRTALAARDFTLFWTAGRLAIERACDTLYDPALLTAALKHKFGAGMPAQIWPYPPVTLLLAAPFSVMPVNAALAIYTAAGLMLLWVALRAGGIGRLARICVLFSPAIAENVLAGQNGALTAAALAGGLLLLDRRPAVAGALLGLLVMKPQFAIMLPVCLVAGRHWRALAAAALCGLCLVALSIVAFGPEPWLRDFLGSHSATTATLEAPWIAGASQRLFVSVFMAMRSFGADLAQAYAAQAAATAFCAALVWHMWRSPSPDPQARIALTLLTAAIGSPWAHGYDLPVAAVAIVMIVDRVKPAFRVLPVLCWLLPGMLSVIAVPPWMTIATQALLLLVVYQQTLAIGGSSGKKIDLWA